MRPTALSNATTAAIAAAKAQCASNLRVVYLGLEGTWSGTVFTKSLRKYLTELLVPVPAADMVSTPGDQEDGAAAVIDTADHFDWRDGASRIILYLGDEALEGGDPQSSVDTAAATMAAEAANAAGVTVFTYRGDSLSNPATAADYANLATTTGGQSFAAPASSLGGFEAILVAAICSGVSSGCTEVQLPTLAPCFELHWGDGPRDRIETEDTEVVCISVCNPYSNVTFTDLTVQLVVTRVDGTVVPNLPDGTPSVAIVPSFELCFGDIGPCGPNGPDESLCVFREAVIKTCGALEGGYRIELVYCFGVSFETLGRDRFQIELVKS